MRKDSTWEEWERETRKCNHVSYRIDFKAPEETDEDGLHLGGVGEGDSQMQGCLTLKSAWISRHLERRMKKDCTLGEWGDEEFTARRFSM